MARGPAPRTKKVVVYTSPTCPWCRVAKAYLLEHEISFTEVDIYADARGRRDMVLMTGQHGVPVLRVGEKAMVGWRAEEFDTLWQR